MLSIVKEKTLSALSFVGNTSLFATIPTLSLKNFAESFRLAWTGYSVQQQFQAQNLRFFEQMLSDADASTAVMLETQCQQLLEGFSTEDAIQRLRQNKLQKGSAEDKIELWNELKVTCLARVLCQFGILVRTFLINTIAFSILARKKQQLTLLEMESQKPLAPFGVDESTSNSSFHDENEKLFIGYLLTVLDETFPGDMQHAIECVKTSFESTHPTDIVTKQHIASLLQTAFQNWIEATRLSFHELRKLFFADVQADVVLTGSLVACMDEFEDVWELAELEVCMSHCFNQLIPIFLEQLSIPKEGQRLAKTLAATTKVFRDFDETSVKEFVQRLACMSERAKLAAVLYTNYDDDEDSVL
ncbi:peroxin-3 peroxisome import protein [Schizosaccharomyces japonicus yFS275]|uniref:Peroxin-3 peroxisome import protein n=1 Tax=Schizosaccharomyces japonicus (strain yFS275 / FY16936) TaxID=402676 RepID=B6K7P6_SCHJY|nr:peroxin-3 peroxisome import protein [Schizosaccharomyces japonicus yFS275]EEB09550.1 peroxin-3 peroxisome import protein [Schizosaccharomyces japonicus yFS275]